MKACLLRAPARVESRPLELADVPVPRPGPDQVLIRVLACGICRTDLHVVEGELPPRGQPVIPGHQVVGIVEQSGAAGLATGSMAGVPWLHRTCGACEYCRDGKENLCERADFTGYTVNGGYAEYIVAPAAFVYPVPAGFSELQAAPLLCAGIIGFRALRLSGIAPGQKLGLYGFGAAAHVGIQVARHWGIEVYVCTRDERHRSLARELGAVWAGAAAEEPPEKLHASIIFAPAGELVPPALAALRKGGSLVLAGIHMSPLPPLEYGLLYHERIIRSVANNTRRDGIDFLELAARIPIETQIQIFPLDQANEGLLKLKRDAIRGAAVLQVASR